VSYPTLVAVGIPPLPANIANLVAGVAIGPGSALSSQRELVETRTVLVRLLPNDQPCWLALSAQLLR
jgi:uncharacterized protein